MTRYFSGRRASLSLFVFSAILGSNVDTSQACSSCGCAFNSDWASEGYTNSTGLRFDARFDYLDQNQLRQGTSSVSKHDFTYPNDQEIQQLTITRELLLGADYSPDKFWGVHVSLPYLVRTHSTIAEGDTDISHSDTKGFGDTQILGRYQGFSPLGNLGVQLGVKLPTGIFSEDFDSGPQAGNRLDRGLQNGTGTVDALFGVYYFGVITQDLEYFAQILADQPLAERESFRPGTSVVTSAGIGYQLTDWIRPQFQMNYHFESREVGDQSDHENSGGNFIQITPGATFFLSPNVNLYTLIQVPIYQDVNGLQLETRAVLSSGVRYTF